MVTALMVRANDRPVITQIVDNRDYLDCIVSTDTGLMFSAVASKIEDGIVAIHSEEGKIMGTPANRKIGRRIIVGTFFIVRFKDGKLISLTDEDIVRFTLRFWEPEIYSEEEVYESWYL